MGAWAEQASARGLSPDAPAIGPCRKDGAGGATWALSGARAGAGSAGEPRPLVLVEKQRGAMRIAAVDAGAAALGIAPGMLLADARAQLPDLAAEEHDAGADQRRLAALADGCGRFTPLVAIDAPDAILLDITGCAHLFGGEEALADTARGWIGARGFAVRAAIADTPEAAVALVRFGGDDLMRLPVAALRLEAGAETALVRAGLRTIGDLAARPSGPLTARLGALATGALARMLGRDDSRLVPRRALPPVRLAHRLPEPVMTVGAALAIVTTLMVGAAETLRARGAGGRRFAIRLCRTDGAVRDLVVETGQPTRDPAVVMRLFAERVETLADPLDPGFGFDIVHLWVPVIEPLAAAQGALAGGDRAEGDTLAALVDRLGVRFGMTRLRRFVPRDTHVPEQAMAAVPVAEARGGAWPVPPRGEPPLRPVLLFDPPQLVEVLSEVPDGPPRRFVWRGLPHRVVLHEGPERIAAPWWRRPPGEEGLTRDYFRVEDEAGQRFWIFRHGLYGEAGRPRWYVHGLFA